MPLILAIEPDRRQAAQLAGVIRHHVGAELILADTTEGALGAIGRRVPDLVLVPALLAPQDDAALASALRVIAAAAHVRTLTIPVFANGVSHKKKTGVLARLGLGREKAKTPDGCQPSVFAEQVLAYLHEAAAERPAIESTAETPDHRRPPTPEPVALPELVATSTPEPVAVPELVATSTPEPIALPVPSLSVYEPPQPETPLESEIVEVVVEVPEASVLMTPAVDATPEIQALAEAAIEAAPQEIQPPPEEVAPLAGDPEEEAAAEPQAEEEQGIDLSDELMRLCDEAEAEADAEAPEFYSIDDIPSLEVTAELEAIIEASAASEKGDLSSPIEEPESADIAELQAALDEPLPEVPWDEPDLDADDTGDIEGELWMPLTLSQRWPAMHVVVSQPPVDQPSASMSAPPETTEPIKSEWVELIESLRLDIERLKTTPQPAAASSRQQAAEPKRAVAKPARATKKKPPIQDEWGFFDPEQCGFAALLAKLDEITDGSEEPAARRPH